MARITVGIMARITVDGVDGEYSSIQAAVDANPEATTFDIHANVYSERVTIPRDGVSISMPALVHPSEMMHPPEHVNAIGIGEQVRNMADLSDQQRQELISDLALMGGHTLHALEQLETSELCELVKQLANDHSDSYEQFLLYQKRMSTKSGDAFTIELYNNNIMTTVPLYREGKSGSNWCAVCVDVPSEIYIVPYTRKFLNPLKDNYYYKINEQIKQYDILEFAADEVERNGFNPIKKIKNNRIFALVTSTSDEKIEATLHNHYDTALIFKLEATKTTTSKVKRRIKLRKNENKR